MTESHQNLSFLTPRAKDRHTDRQTLQTFKTPHLVVGCYIKLYKRVHLIRFFPRLPLINLLPINKDIAIAGGREVCI